MYSEQENNNYFKANFFLGFLIMSVSLSLSVATIPTLHQEVGHSVGVKSNIWTDILNYCEL